MGLRSIHAGLVAVTQRLVQRCDTRPWTEEWRKQRDASAASPMPEDNKAASAAIVKAYGKNGG
jgi:hypothetical protein